MKLYLNIIRGHLDVRPYKTKKLVYAFNSKNVISWINEGRKKENMRNTYVINDVFDYLYGISLLFMDNFGIDQLTIKGLNLFWWRTCRKRPDFKNTQEEYKKLVENMDKFYWEDWDIYEHF